METKLKLADTIKKMKNGMKLRTYKTLDESKGSMPETKVVEQDGRELATFEVKDGELLSSSAEMDAQKGGQYEAAAKKAGVKKEDLIYTAPSMRAAQGGLDSEGLEEPEKMKLTKTEWKVPGLVPVVEEKDKMKKAEINPALTSQEPTHTVKGIKVKHLKAYGDGSHAVEIMEGPHKGKWTQAHEKDMTKLGSDLTKAKNLAPVGTKGIHNASSGSIKIGEKEGSIAGRSFAGDLARQGKTGPAIGWHKEKLTELQSMKKPNLTKSYVVPTPSAISKEKTKEPEQTKTVEPEKTKEPEKTIDYSQLKAPADQSYSWQSKWKAKSPQEKREFMNKLADQRAAGKKKLSSGDLVKSKDDLEKSKKEDRNRDHHQKKAEHHISEANKHNKKANDWVDRSIASGNPKTIYDSPHFDDFARHTGAAMDHLSHVIKIDKANKKPKLEKSKDDWVELSEKLGRDPTDAELADHIGGKVDHAHEQGKDRQENKAKLGKDDGSNYRYEPAPKKKFKNQDEEDAWNDAKDQAKEELKQYGVEGPPKDLKKNFKETIPGGLAAGKKPKDFDAQSLMDGIKVEMEHTGDKNKAQEIAMDHLIEDPRYYIKLKEMEGGDKLHKKQGVPKGADIATHERCIQKVKAQGHNKSSAFAICNAAKAGMKKTDDLEKDVVDIKTGKEMPIDEQKIKAAIQSAKKPKAERTTLSQKMFELDKKLKAEKTKK